jgi:uncharacterized membrane protein/thiol-disulfide isomerase/thioredoxin
MIHKFLSILILLPICLFTSQNALAQAPTAQPVVHAVLFYSPECGHCYQVITEVLPPLAEKYGDQLVIAGVDITDPAASRLFQAVLDHYQMDSWGVPFLVIGDTYLIGSADIPAQLPGLIEQHLAQGGLGWPPIPAIQDALSASEADQATTPTESNQAAAGETESSAPAESSTIAGSSSTIHTSGLGAKFSQDPLGNSLAVIVLLGMLAVGVIAIQHFRRSTSVDSLQRARERRWAWLVPVLCLIGLAVAGYLAYVETTQVQAVCGPVGDCNTVQQSAYARLFGILPIGILGILGYILILACWLVGKYATRRTADLASLIQLVLATCGVLFSIYLTFLEPFVIGATCAWCLTSAILMTAILWLSLPPPEKKKVHHRAAGSARVTE